MISQSQVCIPRSLGVKVNTINSIQFLLHGIFLTVFEVYIYTKSEEIYILINYPNNKTNHSFYYAVGF